MGCIKPLCDLLDVNEVKIIKVAMEGLENILKVTHPFLLMRNADPSKKYSLAHLISTSSRK